MGACGLGMAGVCRALVSPGGNGAPSSPPGFLFARRSEKKLQPLPAIARNRGGIGLERPKTPSYQTFQDFITRGQSLWFLSHDSRRKYYWQRCQEVRHREKDSGSLSIKTCPCVFSPSAPWCRRCETEVPDGSLTQDHNES